MLYEILQGASFGTKLGKCRALLNDGSDFEREIAFHLFEDDIIDAVHDVANRIGLPIGGPPRRTSTDAALDSAFSRLPALLCQLQGSGDDQRMAQLVRETTWSLSLIRAHALSVDLPVFAQPGKSDSAPRAAVPPAKAHGTVDYRATGKPFIKGPGDADDGVGVNDVKQSQIGDCALLSSLIAVARKRPEVIHSMVVDNGNGTYKITLRHAGGTSTTYEEDAVFPALRPGVAYGAHRGSTDAKGNRELWPMLIEKAWADKLGGYDVLDQGIFPADALESITGKAATSTTTESKTGAELINIMCAADRAGKPVVVWTDDRRQPDDTIVDDHAYCYMGIAKEENTLFLRNPWGRKHVYIKPNELQRRFHQVDVGDF